MFTWEIMGIVESCNPQYPIVLENVQKAFLVRTKQNEYSVVIQTDRELIALELSKDAAG